MRRLVVALAAVIPLLTTTPAQAVSYGWTGYDWYNSSDATAWAIVTVPWFNCTGLGGDRFLIPWVGVSTGSKLQQAGLTMHCNGDTGTKWISAWYENFPEDPVSVTESVNPHVGDSIRIRVDVYPHHTDYLIRNLTTGDEWSDVFRIDRNVNNSDRIYVAERFGGSAGVPHFGKLVFEKPNGFPCDLCFMGTSRDFGKLSDFYDGRTKFNVTES